jgi:hypothetical protein
MFYQSEPDFKAWAFTSFYIRKPPAPLKFYAVFIFVCPTFMLVKKKSGCIL